MYSVEYKKANSSNIKIYTKMVLHSKKARAAVARLKRIVDEYKEEQPEKKRDWRTYEQQHYARLKYPNS